MDIESDFCRECPEYGEPNGCNRSTGSCDAYNSCLELQTELAKYKRALGLACEQISDYALPTGTETMRGKLAAMRYNFFLKEGAK